MPQRKMVKRTITFNEEAHSYIDEDKNSYISVTTIIEKYSPQFQREYWANQKALEAGVSPEIIKANWDKITKDSHVKGNNEHKLLENSVISSTKPKSLLNIVGVPITGHKFTNVDIDLLAQSEMAKKYPTIFAYIKQKVNEGWCIYVEKRVYWFEYLIAGTIDVLLIKGKQFMIVDWKTNKDELKFKSGYYKKVNGIKTNEWIDKKEYLLTPLQNIEKCKGNGYTMQLSLYAYIMELWGFECVGLVLFHIRDNMLPTQYKIDYWKSSCQILLIHHKNVSTQSKNNLNNNNQGTIFGIT